MKEQLIIVLVYVLIIAPTWFEVFIIDPFRKKPYIKIFDHKLISTYIRIMVMFIISLLVEWPIYYGHWYLALLVIFSFHLLTFDIMRNIKLRKPISYVSDYSPFQIIRMMPFWARINIALVDFIVCTYLFEHFKL